jgi:hypothetical protein
MGKNRVVKISSTLSQQLWWKRILRDPLFGRSLIIVGAWRIILEIVNQATGHIERHASFVGSLTQWAHWDGDWYLNIITSGYGTPDRPANVAFFPAFPTIVTDLSKLLHTPPLYIGLVLNILVTVAAVYLLMKLAQFLAGRYGLAQRGQTIALITGVSFLAYYSSFFLAAFYADALLVLGLIGAIYFAYTKRLWLSVPFMIAASASKITGSIVVGIVGLVVLEEWLRERGSVWQLLGRWCVCASGFLGLVGYVLYLKVTFNHALLFYTAEKAWGRSHEGFFVTNIAHGYYPYFFSPHHFQGLFAYGLSVTIMALPFVALLAGLFIARVYKTYWPLVLALLTISVPLSTSLMESLNRYCLVLAPLLPFLILWLSRKIRPAFLYALCAASLSVMLLMAYIFLDGRIFAG